MLLLQAALMLCTGSSACPADKRLPFSHFAVLILFCFVPHLKAHFDTLLRQNIGNWEILFEHNVDTTSLLIPGIY